MRRDTRDSTTSSAGGLHRLDGLGGVAHQPLIRQRIGGGYVALVAVVGRGFVQMLLCPFLDAVQLQELISRGIYRLLRLDRLVGFLYNLDVVNVARAIAAV